MKKMPNGYMSFEDACKKLNISSPSLYVLIKRGKIVKYKVLGKTMFNIDDVEELLKPKPVTSNVN